MTKSGRWQRYVATLTAISLLVVVLLAVTTIVLATNQVTRDVNTQVRSTASVSAVVVGQKVSDLVALVKSDATRSSLADDVTAGPGGDALVETNLATLAHAYPGVSASFVVTLAGTSSFVYPLEPAIIGTSFAYRDWYKGLVASGRPYISSAIVTHEVGNPLAVTITDYIKGPSGQNVAILGVEYGLSAITTFARHVGRAQGITLTVTDGSGTSLTAGGAHGLISLERDPRVHAALDGRTGLITFAPAVAGGRRGPAQVSAYAPITGPHWAVVASVRHSVAFAGLNRLRKTVFLSALILILLLLAVGVTIAFSGRRRREAEFQVQRREREMVRVLESIDEAFVSITAGGEITGWNHRAEALCGWSASAVLGKSLAECVVAPEHRDAFTSDLAQYRSGAHSALVGKRREMTVLHRDGHHIPVEVGLWALDDQTGFSAFMHDISPRRDAQAALSAARDEAAATASLLASIVNSSVDAIFGEELDGTITSWNRGAERMYGHRAEEVIGENAAMLFPAEHLGELDTALDGVKSGQVVEQHDTQRIRKDGTALDVSVTIAPIYDSTGVITGASVIDRDITQRLALERERLALEARLNQSERLESMGRLAGGIAHDFNNLLGVILNYATFVSEELDDEAAALADLEHIRTAAQRASALTRQLLAFARKEVMQPRVLDLNDVVSGVEELLRRTISEQVELSITLAPDLWRVEVDPGRIEQVLVNLVINARDAMPEGGKLFIDTKNVDVDHTFAQLDSPLVPGHYVRLRVSDTGFGMSTDVLQHAFEPFFTTKATGEGTGLGLPMVYGIIRQAGGDIRVYSEIGLGTSCNVYLPVSDLAPAVPLQVETPGRVRGSETIMIVDDEDALREVASRILTRNGYVVMTSANGPDAIADVQAFDGTIDLLLSDVIMPRMLGKEVAQRIRALRPEIPVLFMSGYAQPVLGSTLGENFALLEKPFTEQQLLTEVRNVLEASR